MDHNEADEERLKLIEENYDGIEYSQNVELPANPVEELPRLNLDESVDSGIPAIPEKPAEIGVNLEMGKIAESEVDSPSELENPGDYYLNEGDSDYDFGDSSTF